MKIGICLDSFKDSFDTIQINEMLEILLTKDHKYLTVKVLPISDGGEGVLNVLAYHDLGDFVQVNSLDPLFRPINAKYLYDEHKKTAYIEMARASGLQLLTKDERNASLTSTFGTGLLIKDAVLKGAKVIELFVGGSATNDAGIGMAEALGVKFYSAGEELQQLKGVDLSRIESVKIGAALDQFKDIVLHVNCDVNNVLLGKEGASYVYGSQKGASQIELDTLEEGMKSFVSIIKSTLGTDYENVPGSGAAGGISYGVLSLLKGKLRSGTETLFNMIGLNEKLKDVDVIITGEGKIDAQSMNGKLVSGIAQLAKDQNKRLLCVSAISDISDQQLQKLGIERLFTLYDVIPSHISVSDSERRLQNTCNEIVTYLTEKTTL